LNDREYAELAQGVATSRARGGTGCAARSRTASAGPVPATIPCAPRSAFHPLQQQWLTHGRDRLECAHVGRPPDEAERGHAGRDRARHHEYHGRGPRQRADAMSFREASPTLRRRARPIPWRSTRCRLSPPDTFVTQTPASLGSARHWESAHYAGLLEDQLVVADVHDGRRRSHPARAKRLLDPHALQALLDVRHRLGVGEVGGARRRGSAGRPCTRQCFGPSLTTENPCSSGRSTTYGSNLPSASAPRPR